MRIQRKVTHVGHGRWGMHGREDYDLAVVDECRIYRDLAGDREQRIQAFLLAFRRSDQDWTWRRFDTDSARKDFVEAKMGTYDLFGPIPQSESSAARVYHPVHDLVESKVCTVSFIGGHLVLEFDAGRLDFHRWPEYVVNGVTYHSGESGYRDGISGLLDRCVTGLDECLDVGLVLHFVDGPALHLSLREQRGEEPEDVASFSNHQGTTYAWRGGQAPFAA